MRIERTSVPGVMIYTPDVYEDDRGFFQEISNQHYFFNPQQANMSYSKKGVIRGLHAQPHTAKLVWVAKGSILDLAYDPKTNKGVQVELSADNHKQLLVPAGMYHGMQALEDDTIVCYLMSNLYDPVNETALNPSLVDWPIKEAIISDKDRNAPELPS